MTLLQALDALRDAGAVLALDIKGPVLRGDVPAGVVETLRDHREQVVALLQLRRLHARMGFDSADVELIERALLAGQIDELRFIVPAPVTAPA